MGLGGSLQFYCLGATTNRLAFNSSPSSNRRLKMRIERRVFFNVILGATLT
jgi:hypothetical protein